MRLSIVCVCVCSFRSWGKLLNAVINRVCVCSFRSWGKLLNAVINRVCAALDHGASYLMRLSIVCVCSFRSWGKLLYAVVNRVCAALGVHSTRECACSPTHADLVMVYVHTYIVYVHTYIKRYSVFLCVQ